MPERSHVELSLPAEPSLLRLVRENAGLIAEAAGFGREEADDFRLAVDELCVWCSSDHGPNARVRLRFLWDKSAVAVRCDVEPAGTAAPDADGANLPAGLRQEEISARLLGELVDSYTVEVSRPGHKRGWLVKRHRPEVARSRTAADGGSERTSDSGGSKDG
jgi:hypothetical protein